MRFTVVCSMKDEGPFIVEWVSWYRMLGFTDIVLVTNDCTDHSPQLINALVAAGWVTHLVHDVPSGQRVCATKLTAAGSLAQVQTADWVLVCDVDEFLVIHRGAGRIGDLIPENAPFLGMSINWRVFGSSGIAEWQDGLTHRQFLNAAETSHPTSRWIKSIHSRPGWFRRLGEHGPRVLKPRRAADWGKPGMVWVNADGRPVPRWTPEGDYMRRIGADLTSHATAQMNHYMVRSAESFALKRGTLSSVAAFDRYTDRYFETNDRNEVPDTSALRYAPEFDRVFAEAMALPQVAALHHRCCADYLERMAAKAGRDVRQYARWQHHTAKAK